MGLMFCAILNTHQTMRKITCMQVHSPTPLHLLAIVQCIKFKVYVCTSTLDDTGDVYLPFLSLDALYGVDQMFLDSEDDGESDSISVQGFPFGTSTRTQVYVSKRTYSVQHGPLQNTHLRAFSIIKELFVTELSVVCVVILNKKFHFMLLPLQIGIYKWAVLV